MTEQICIEKPKILGLVSIEYVFYENLSLLLVLASLIFRLIFKWFVKITRFTSKSLETTVITLTVCVVFTMVYGFLYLDAPKASIDANLRVQDEQFVPYYEQTLDAKDRWH